MPVMAGYIHADTPHEKTVQPAGYRYGCTNTQRGGETIYWAHPWSTMGAEIITTDWLPIHCGHTTREIDPACEGCCNRGEK